MSWSQVSERRWERPSNGMEGYFVVSGHFSASHCDGRQHYTLFFRLRVDLNLPDVEAALRQAWKQLRYEQPHIATTVEGMTRVYEVPENDAALQAWLDATFIVSSASSAEELRGNVSPVDKATLYYMPQSSELVFRAPHHAIDGIGALLLLHSYMSAVATPKPDAELVFGDEPTRLPPAVEEVLGHPNPPRQDMVDKATALMAGGLSALPGVGPISHVGVVPSGPSRSTELVLPAKETADLIQACKNKGISVTTAVHAAYVQAVVQNADPSGTTSHYASVSSFDFRRFLPEPYSTSRFAASLYYSPFPFKLELPASFAQAAQALDQHYKATFNNSPETQELSGSLTRALREIVQTPEFLASPVARDALVSSLGITERQLQRSYGDIVTVHDISFGVDVVLGISMLFIYTFRDQLRLSYCFNEGFEEPSNIQKLLDDVRATLDTELLASK